MIELGRAVDFDHLEKLERAPSGRSFSGIDLEIGADLVVLSHTAVSGNSPSSFDNDIGFVSDFLAMGAGAVLASMWVGQDRDSIVFIGQFYEHLAAGLDASEALSQTWKEHLKSDDKMNLGSWAGFQLFIR